MNECTDAAATFTDQMEVDHEADDFLGEQMDSDRGRADPEAVESNAAVLWARALEVEPSANRRSAARSAARKMINVAKCCQYYILSQYLL